MNRNNLYQQLVIDPAESPDLIIAELRASGMKYLMIKGTEAKRN